MTVTVVSRSLACMALGMAMSVGAIAVGCGGNGDKPDDQTGPSNRPYGNWNDPDNTRPADNSTTNPTHSTSNQPGSSNDVAANDRIVVDQLRRAEREFAKGDYSLARHHLVEAQKVAPVSPTVETEREQWSTRINTFAQVFSSVTRLTTNAELKTIFYHGSGKVVGVILEDDSRKKFILVRTLEGRYETVDRSAIGDIQRFSESKQREQLDSQYGRLKYEFSRRQNSTAVDFFRFAQTAWRYGKATEAHQNLSRAFELDADIHETVRMEADEKYQRFTMATATGKLDEARRLLRELGETYPNATLFKEARRQLDMAERAPRTRSESAPVVSSAIENHIFSQIDRESAQVAASMQSAHPVDVSRNADLNTQLNASAADMVRAADRHFADGQTLESRSLPGMPNADENLQKAVFHYRMAQELFAKALQRGGNRGEIEPKQVQLNKALFWARKRLPIH